jgi:hypothetical protein
MIGIETVHNGSTLHVALCGCLDPASEKKLENTVNANMENTRNIVLDFKKVRNMELENDEIFRWFRNRVPSDGTFLITGVHGCLVPGLAAAGFFDHRS